MQIEIGGKGLTAGIFQLDHLGGERFFRVLLTDVLRIPHQMRVGVDNHARFLCSRRRVRPRTNR